MRSVLACSALALALAAGAALPPAAHAANWRNPYGNVNHANDAGNDTGDSQVDRLNSAQLDQNYYGGQGQGQGQMSQGSMYPSQGAMPMQNGPAMGSAPPQQ